ncbi:DNA polymerase beta superfamily protein [Bacillus paranthracis]|uniref:DNA polymerase beta superfamily protein n=1 Tax=Bacillus paranthracis TaxID=2026186 RepID=UPI002D765620|nr:nucleotidyltransferase domain-containing protein [Bacillus paranthracis]
MEREVLLKANTGSWNYNLQQTKEELILLELYNHKPSDKDYKMFVAPTFEDLYTGKMYHKAIITDVEDNDIHDIRKLSDLLYKSNIAYLELLFSKDIVFKDCEELQFLYSVRHEIARMNLPQLFKSTGGMFNQRMKKLDHATEGTQHLVNAYGWNTKEGLHTFRSVNLLVRYEETDFTDFESALRYENHERQALLDIKNGTMTKEEFIRFVTQYHDNVFAPLKERYCSYKPNEELKQAIDFNIMKLVEKSVLSKSIA